jgi:hypothetical protein
MDVQAASGHRDQEYQDKTGGKNGHDVTSPGEASRTAQVVSRSAGIRRQIRHCSTLGATRSSRASHRKKSYWAEMRAYTVSLLRRGGVRRPPRTTTSVSTTCPGSPVTTPPTRR